MPSKTALKRGYPIPALVSGHNLIDVCLKIPDNFEYRTAFTGHLALLGKWWTWDREDGKNGRNIEAAQYWRTLLYEHLRIGESCVSGDNCNTHYPDSPLVQYFPQNPYTEPDVVTEGYDSPAWYLATPLSNIVLGTQTGDVVTDLTRFPPGSLPSILPASGLPRFRITVESATLLRVHLLNIFAGSIVQVTVNDDLTTLQFVECNRDTLGAPPETPGTVIVEVDIPTHPSYVDFIVVSQLNDAVPFLHHGGGLRRFELCGGAAAGDCVDCPDEYLLMFEALSDALDSQHEMIVNLLQQKEDDCLDCDEEYLAVFDSLNDALELQHEQLLALLEAQKDDCLDCSAEINQVFVVLDQALQQNHDMLIAQAVSANNQEINTMAQDCCQAILAALKLIQLQLKRNEELFLLGTGSPIAAPNAPGDTFGSDSGDTTGLEANARAAALCDAVGALMFVMMTEAKYYITDQLQRESVEQAIDMVFASTLVAPLYRLFYDPEVFETIDFADALGDVQAVRNVICCFYRNLSGASVGQQSFYNAFKCPEFDENSHERKIQEIMLQLAKNEANYRLFIIRLSDNFNALKSGTFSPTFSCACGQPGGESDCDESVFDFTQSPEGWYAAYDGLWTSQGWKQQQVTSTTQNLQIKYDCLNPGVTEETIYARITIAKGYNSGGTNSFFFGYYDSNGAPQKGGGYSIPLNTPVPFTIVKTFAAGIDLASWGIWQAAGSSSEVNKIIVSKVETQTVPYE